MALDGIFLRHIISEIEKEALKKEKDDISKNR